MISLHDLSSYGWMTTNADYSNDKSSWANLVNAFQQLQRAPFIVSMLVSMVQNQRVDNKKSMTNV